MKSVLWAKAVRGQPRLETRQWRKMTMITDCAASEASGTRHKASLLLALVLGTTAHAATLHSPGILANSGEAGDTLVHFAQEGSSGMGAALDRFGTLWDRAGDERLNRYSLDGRLIAHYTCPNGTDRNKDTVSVVGDTVVVCVRGWLHRLNINSPSGASTEPLNIEALMSHGSHRGRIACLGKNRQLSLLDPSTGENQTIATLEFDPESWMDMDADGSIYVMDGRWQMHKIVEGKEVRDGWPKGSPGEEPQVIDTDDGRFWFGHSWHGTIKRFDADLRPAPGVVQGGASGHFIGHLPQNSELNNGRGMANIKGRLYAVSGMGCVMHLLEWNPDTRKMDIIRRLGSLPRLAGLGLDRDGRILVVNGIYEWADRPDSPQRLGTTGDVCGQVVMLPNDCVAAPGIQYGNQSRIMFGRLNAEVRIGGNDRITLNDNIQKNGCGTAVYAQGDKLVLLIVSRDGKTQAGHIPSDGNWQGGIADVSLETSKSVSAWTTLTMKNDRTLLAAADGHVIEFTPNGTNWKEARRWKEPAMSESGPFGSEIYIAADKPVINISYGSFSDQPHRKTTDSSARFQSVSDAVRLGAREAFAKGADGESYTQEIALPWKLITAQNAIIKETGEPYGAPKAYAAGGEFRMGMEFLWGGPDGKTWPIHRYADLLKEGQSDREFFWTAERAWGTVRLEPAGNLPRIETASRAEDLYRQKTFGPITFSYEMPFDGFATIVIDDDQGKRVRNLIGMAPRAAGRRTECWDGADDEGKTVSPGAYRWRGLVNAGIDPTYEATYGSPGQPAWSTADGTGDWLSDHNPNVAVASGAGMMVIAAGGSEAGWAMIGTDLDGRRKWGERKFQSIRDLAVLGKHVYIATDPAPWNGVACPAVGRCTLDAGAYAPFASGEGDALSVPLATKDEDARIAGIAPLDGHLAVGLSGPDVIRIFHKDSMLNLEEIAIVRKGQSYAVEARIPLAAIGFAPQEGTTYKLDLGAIFSDATGTNREARVYWANSATGLVNDVPGEIMATPNAWGRASVQH